MGLNLINVYEDLGAIEFLWDLLAHRDFDTVTLSHREMPSIGEHIEFVMSKPYKSWHIIYADDCMYNDGRVGSIYLSHKNEIGIFIANYWQRRGAATWAIGQLGLLHPSVDEFYANINPRNKPSIMLFTSLLFQDYQRTMRYRRDGNYGRILPRFEERVHERPEEHEAPPDPRSGKPSTDSKEAVGEQGEVSERLETLWGARVVAHAGVRKRGPEL